MKIWYAQIQHRYGDQNFHATTEQNMTEQLFEYVQENWGCPVPDSEMPEDPKEAIQTYFDAQEPREEKGDFLGGPEEIDLSFPHPCPEEHDRLSEALEDPEADDLQLRDAAVRLCAALNREFPVADKHLYTVVLLHPHAEDATDNPIVHVSAEQREDVEGLAKQEAAKLWNEDDDIYAPEEFEICAVFPGTLCTC